MTSSTIFAGTLNRENAENVANAIRNVLGDEHVCLVRSDEVDSFVPHVVSPGGTRMVAGDVELHLPQEGEVVKAAIKIKFLGQSFVLDTSLGEDSMHYNYTRGPLLRVERRYVSASYRVNMVLSHLLFLVQ